MLFRMFAMLQYENKAESQGYLHIAGVDEAGRGPLAGPVVASAVILPANVSPLDGLTDSKKLTLKQREHFFPLIKQVAVAYATETVSSEVIDEINILQASLLAMKQAVEKLSQQADLLLIDGNQRVKTSTDQWTIVKGDSLSLSIAAASVLAKVTRDKLMEDYHAEYPQYEFARHKGYGTKLHRDRINQHGPCPIHRRSFRGVLPEEAKNISST
jgi:ribonuclease HII